MSVLIISLSGFLLILKLRDWQTPPAFVRLQTGRKKRK